MHITLETTKHMQSIWSDQQREVNCPVILSAKENNDRSFKDDATLCSLKYIHVKNLEDHVHTWR